MTCATPKTLLLALAVASAGCRTEGPSLTLRNPDGHALFVDGRRVMRAERPDAARRAPPDSTTAPPVLSGDVSPGSSDLSAPSTSAQSSSAQSSAAQSSSGRPGYVELPFRYYGATRWDALPQIAEENGVPVFDARPRSEAVALPPPVSPWLFPLDFPLEALDRLLYGRRDVDLIVTARARPAPQGRIGDEAFGELSARARAARSER